MAKESFFHRFSAPSGDPLATEHEAVALYVTQALASLGKESYWKDLDLKAIPAGQVILAAKPEQARRFLLAAVAQSVHWEREIEQVRAQAKNVHEQMNAHHLPGWLEAYGPQRQTMQVAQALLRRSLPLKKDDIRSLLAWCISGKDGISFMLPIGFVTRAIERYIAEESLDQEIRAQLEDFGKRLRASHDKDSKRFATAVEQMCAGEGSLAETPVPTTRTPAPRPSQAGNPTILVALKQKLGVAGTTPEVPHSETGADRFSLRADSPLGPEHEKLNAVMTEVVGTTNYYSPDFRKLASGRAVLDTSRPERGRMLLAGAERRIGVLLAPAAALNEPAVWQSRYAAAATVSALRHSPVDLDRAQLFDFLLYLSALQGREILNWAEDFPRFLTQLESESARDPLTEGERYVLFLWRACLMSGPPLGTSSQEIAKLTALIGDGAMFFLVPGEAWSDALNTSLTELPARGRAAWKDLLVHALTATASRPSEKWLKTGRKLIEGVGAETARDFLSAWLALVQKGQTIRKPGAGDVIHEENATCLRGLLWLVPLLLRRDDLARTVSSVALSAYQKIPGVGPRAVKVGNAAVYALSELGSTDAVGQLAMLKVRVKFGTAQKEIEKAFDASAQALGLPRDQIEEMGVPSYGLEEVGRLKESIGQYQAELLVTGSDAELKWSDAAGKALKSVPAALKKEHGEELKELQQSLKDIQAMLPAQRDRIDALFLSQKSWPLGAWRERYLDHPLVGSISRRLIWCVDGAPALFLDGTASDVHGKSFRASEGATITLWHPVGRSVVEITSWRRRLESLGVTQPFKQAHREIYLLTDAELRTRTYSNRFAAHILRQHQFNALCAARGWKNKLRLMVDDTYPPATRDLPQWGLRVEFWIEGVGTEYGGDTNESGVYLRVATDQVRFYRRETAESRAHAGGGGYAANAGGPAHGNDIEPLTLDLIPPLVFSESMRDVDLFVGVGSVGNDPTWQDGGPQGAFRAYWQSYSFGELSASAATRREVLQRLVPRLKIADRCSFADRFLIVRGEKRTYKIHLGSGNILMEPNDQYLCIVPDQRARSAEESLYLPFEGDSVLSIIISKALLLAADSKIKDPTIVTQIEKV